MHNLTSPAPAIGDFLVWPDGGTFISRHAIVRIGADGQLFVRYMGSEYGYRIDAGGKDYPALEKAAPKPPVRLTAQAATVLAHIKRAGGITQREALMDHSIQSLTRRITELNRAGFITERTFNFHPLTSQRYARYSLKAAA